jgi:hypothetical protein
MQDLQSSFVALAILLATLGALMPVAIIVAAFRVLMAITIIFATVGVVMSFLLLAAFLPLRMQFETGHAALGIAVALDISIALAQADDQDFILVRRRVDSQVEAIDLKLQHTVVDEGTDARGHVDLVCRSSPLRTHELTTLR